MGPLRISRVARAQCEGELVMGDTESASIKPTRRLATEERKNLRLAMGAFRGHVDLDSLSIFLFTGRLERVPIVAWPDRKE